MSKDFENFYDNDDSIEFRNQIVRYISFWPYLLLLIISFIFVAFLYLRYTPATKNSSTIIEILDESQNSEMALPTELTVFNRSMINLENEINRLNSYNLNSIVVKEINSNILFYKIGRLKSEQKHSESWYDDYELDFLTDTDLTKKKSEYSIITDEGKLSIGIYKNDNLVETLNFSSLSTLSKDHNLPFNLTIKSDKELEVERKLIINTVKSMANRFRKKIQISVLGKESDQLSILLNHENSKIAEDYLNQLVKSFDSDGILDRELEYRRTIEFVNTREKILKTDLNSIELRKQTYKQDNNLSDITLDANNNINLKYTYNSDIFKYESQKQIAEYLIELIDDSKYEFLPLNIGLEDFDLNQMIKVYNEKISERYLYIDESGSNNFLVKSLEPQLDKLIENISASLISFSSSLDLRLENLRLKEFEFDEEYNRVPENEKTLRAIDRELSIKEALYLLLLQKREEAAINLAVVKPTVKIIDYAITDPLSEEPNERNIYLFSVFGAILFYITVLYVWFYLDNKVHNKEQLSKLLNKEIPIIAEIPYVKDISLIETEFLTRSVISESTRMLLSNLRFTVKEISSESYKSAETILFTSSIKGEGKTLASVSTAISIANDLNKQKKVILLGTDLRNPQIHKNFGVDKTKEGISEIIYKNEYKNYNDYIYKFDNLDILFSGTIPPNPTALLSSDIFKNLIELLKKDYDYIIIDSAPCLLVSDTLQYIDSVDSVVFLFRSNFTDSKIVNFINELGDSNKIKNLNVVLNAVGNSASYGYKYGYQYGYKYGYKYGYNYGYGYGYNEDS